MGLAHAREIAYDAFVQVMEHKRKPEYVLEEYYEKHHQNLRRLDKNFIKRVIYDDRN